MTVDFRDPDTGHVKEPGGWRRKGENGPPIVTDVNGETVKKGTNAGRVKLHTYSRPSNFGKQVENTYNLERWKNRQGIIGIYLAPELLDEMDELWKQPDHDTESWKEAVDSIYKRASEAAGAMVAAERGTFGHAITEDHDLGRSVITRIERGEDLGIPEPLQRAIKQAWERLVDEHFEILAVEAGCVYDHWRVAGTLDRIVSLKHDMTFSTPTGNVTFPAGTVVVLDIKTGGLKVAPRTQTPLYWHSYAVQIAAYARSVPYDVDTEKRGVWPWPINPNHAIIAHIDIAGAIDTGVLTTRLIYVDIAAGHDAGDLVVEAKDWQKQDDVFGTVNCYESNITVEGVGEPDRALTGDCDGCPNECGRCDAAAQPAPDKPIDTDQLAYDVRKQALYDRYDKLDPELQTVFGSQVTAIDATDLDAVEALLDNIENPPSVTELAKQRMADDAERAGDQPPPQTSDRRLSVEGGRASQEDVNTFEGRWELGLNDRGRRWIARVVREAMDASRDFRLSDLNSQRRADIYCALTEWATVDEFDDHNDEPFRAALVTATDDETCADPEVTLGLAVGNLSTVAAAHLRHVVTEIAGGRMTLVIDADPDVAPRWEPIKQTLSES